MMENKCPQEKSYDVFNVLQKAEYIKHQKHVSQINLQCSIKTEILAFDIKEMNPLGGFMGCIFGVYGQVNYASPDGR